MSVMKRLCCVSEHCEQDLQGEGGKINNNTTKVKLYSDSEVYVFLQTIKLH